jgi:hypothetical protein
MSQKKRGRPREANALRSSISVRLPERVHDDLIGRANTSSLTPAEWARRVVISALYKDQSKKSVPH